MRLLAALALVASGLVLQSQVPAVAAGCTGSTGVTVVVDHHQLGGGVQQACDADGGGKAASTVFPDSGFPLTYVQRQPGFVCRVAGAPSSDPCVNTPPASAYWSLWWSDGKSGTWTYASTGVGSLTVPDGGYVAFSWQGQDGKAAPGVTPTPRAASSSPSPSPSAGDSGGGGGTTGTAAHRRGAAPGPAAAPRRRRAATPPRRTRPPVPAEDPPRTASARRPRGTRRRRRPRRRPSRRPRPRGALSADSPPSGGTSPAAGEPGDDGGGLPVWVSVLAVGGLLTGAAAVAADPGEARVVVTRSLRAARLPRELHPVAWWVWALGLATAASFTLNPLVLLLVIGVAATGRRAAQDRPAVGRVVPAVRRAGLLDHRGPGAVPDRVRRRRRADGAVPAARDPAARRGRRDPAAGAGHPRGGAGRAVRRAAARDAGDLHRRRERAGQPQAAAPVAAAGAVRDRHRAGGGHHGAAAVRRQRPAGARRAGTPRRPGRPVRRAAPGRRAGARGRPRALAAAGGGDGRPRLRAVRRRPRPGPAR